MVGFGEASLPEMQTAAFLLCSHMGLGRQAGRVWQCWWRERRKEMAREGGREGEGTSSLVSLL